MKQAPTPANGSATANTTQLTLKFSKSITGLVITNITVSNNVKADKLGGSGSTYTVDISGLTSSTPSSINVTIAKSGVSSTAQAVTINYSTAVTAATYFGGYNAPYYLGTPAALVNERIKFESNKLVIWDSTVGTLNYIEFEITKWEDATTPTWTVSTEAPAVTPANFKVAFKLTGKIKGAYPVSTNPAALYGTKTAPGFTQADITNGTPAYIFLYIQPEDSTNDVALVRSIFTKTGTAAADLAPITSSKGATSGVESIRTYTESPAAANYPNYSTPVTSVLLIQ